MVLPQCIGARIGSLSTPSTTWSFLDKGTSLRNQYKLLFGTIAARALSCLHLVLTLRISTNQCALGKSRFRRSSNTKTTAHHEFDTYLPCLCGQESRVLSSWYCSRAAGQNCIWYDFFWQWEILYMSFGEGQKISTKNSNNKK